MDSLGKTASNSIRLNQLKGSSFGKMSNLRETKICFLEAKNWGEKLKH